jgi:hypothetical protein
MYSDGHNKASFKGVDLHSANITGQVAMTGASFGGKLDAANLHVGGDLYTRSEGENKASFKKDVRLNGAKIDGNVSMTRRQAGRRELAGRWLSDHARC